MLGLLDDKTKTMGLAFQNEGDLIYLIGESRNDINSSEYLTTWHKQRLSPAPYFNMEEELTMQGAVSELISSGLILSAHDVADGGLFTTLAESGFVNRLGFNIATDDSIRKDAFLFGEAQGRVVVSVAPGKQEELVEMMAMNDVPFSLIGTVTTGDIWVDDEFWGSLETFADGYDTALGKIMDQHV
jgi:phosphoribosylformylglycinamidine synthase